MPGVRVADDLVQRDFTPAAPNVLWVADITYLRTWEGWLYLAAIQDAYSRRIVGWSMADHMRSELVVDALQMALARRRPGPGLVHHSDQGSQFVSLAFGQAAGKAGIARSMGSRGDCFDNAVAESFFATLKKELVRRRTWPTRRELTGEVFDYIEAFYNPRRRHSTLGYLSPVQFEKINHPSRRNHLTTRVRQSGGTPVVHKPRAGHRLDHRAHRHPQVHHPPVQGAQAVRVGRHRKPRRLPPPRRSTGTRRSSCD